MTKSYYNYASRKHKILALIFNLVGIVLAFVSLLIELPRRNHTFGFGYSDGTLPETFGLWDGPGLPIFAMILLIVACVLSCVALKKKTTFTLPALIVSALAYVFTDVIICVFAPKSGAINILWSAPLLLAAWIVFMCGHGGIPTGQRHKKLLLAGTCCVLAVTLAMCVFQTAVSVGGTKSVDYDSEIRIFGRHMSAYEMLQADKDKPTYDRVYYSDNLARTYEKVKSVTSTVSRYDEDDVVDLFSDYGINYWYSDYCILDGPSYNTEALYNDRAVRYSYVIECYAVDNVTYRYNLYSSNKYYYDGYYSPFEVLDNLYPDLEYDDSNQYAYTFDYYYNSEVGDYVECVRIFEYEYSTEFPNVFAYLAAACVAVAYYMLGRSELDETVVEIPDPQPVFVNRVGAASSSNSDGAPAPVVLGFTVQNIVMNIFLTVITFGIYGYVWFYRNAKCVRRINGESDKGCGDELLLYIFGGSLYRMYWYYTRSKQINATVKELGLDGIFLSPMLYLLLSVFTPTVFQLAFLTANFNTLYNRIYGNSENQGKATEDATAYLAQRHGLLKVVLLGLVTCGVYFIITQVRIANRIKLMQGKQSANKAHLICMLLVPFYWIFWLLTFKDKYHEGSNEATLEAWLLIVIPFYSIYWLITRTAELRVGAEQFGVKIAEEAVWTLLFAMITPVVSYANMLININRVADTLSIEA